MTGVKVRVIALGLAAGLTTVATACGGGNGNAKNPPKDATSPAAKTSSGPAASGSAADGVSAPDNGPSMEGDHAIIRSEALGPLHVGEWERPVMSFVYAISARVGRDSEDIITVHGIGKDTASLTFRNDTLRRIFVTHAGPHTTDGIGVGTPFASVTSQAGASTVKRGTAQVTTLSRMCGVEFATDSAALSPDSTVRRAVRRAVPRAVRSPATVRGIAIGYCKR